MRVVIVDGYNVLWGSDRYRQIAERDLESARSILVNDVAAWTQNKAEAFVIFDAADNPYSDGTAQVVSGVSVMFSGSGRDADSVIEELVSGYRKSAGETIVVTSDLQTQWVTMGSGVTRMSAAEFGHEIDRAEEHWRQSTPGVSGTSRIEDRIDPVVRETLLRWSGWSRRR